jgi:hypothetical protein
MLKALSGSSGFTIRLQRTQPAGMLKPLVALLLFGCFASVEESKNFYFYGSATTYILPVLEGSGK